jgi:hypothetical protein
LQQPENKKKIVLHPSLQTDAFLYPIVAWKLLLLTIATEGTFNTILAL